MPTPGQSSSLLGAKPVQRPGQGRPQSLAQRPAQTVGQRPIQNPVQRPAQNPAHQSQTVTKTTTQKVVHRPGGHPLQVVETEEHVIKKTIWTRALTGLTGASKAVTHPGQAARRLIPGSSKSSKSSQDRNLSYYRKTFFFLDPQTQFDLYMAGMAPRMTEREVKKLRSAARQVRRTYKPVSLMYEAQAAPNGFRAPLRDLVAEAQAAKARAAASKKTKKPSASNPDALPTFPTPGTHVKIQVQQHPRPTATAPQPRPQQPQKPQHYPQRRQQRPPQHPPQHPPQQPPQPPQQQQQQQQQQRPQPMMTPQQRQQRAQALAQPEPPVRYARPPAVHAPRPVRQSQLVNSPSRVHPLHPAATGR
ncbi:uncharacterized protein B0T15DRAFT_109592 [Chaetomium strumarium]|uniref:Uncharacterized protein n=1 Tax=Chaetomium strumarium TaxID=1170767 RepID=A0AAJ0M4I7_9PEZI|nr:hypothetical protein B0T15DRAFT_109592 [Chaetomium strumarium]